MLPAAARAAVVVLLVLALVVARRERAHRPLAAWLLALNALTWLGHWVLTPYLRGAPRPYTGVARLVLHTNQLLSFALQSAFVTVAWFAFGARGRRLAWPFAVGALALLVLVAGYHFSPGPGLYRLGPVTFRSATVYAATAWASAALECVGMALLARDPSKLAPRVTCLALVTLAAMDLLRLLLPFAHPVVDPRVGLSELAAVMLTGYVCAIAAHVAWLVSRAGTALPRVGARAAIAAASGAMPSYAVASMAEQRPLATPLGEGAAAADADRGRDEASASNPLTPLRGVALAAGMDTVQELRRRYPVLATRLDRAPPEVLAALAQIAPRGEDETNRVEAMLVAVEGLPQGRAVHLATIFVRLLMEVESAPAPRVSSRPPPAGRRA